MNVNAMLKAVEAESDSERNFKLNEVLAEADAIISSAERNACHERKRSIRSSSL